MQDIVNAVAIQARESVARFNYNVAIRKARELEEIAEQIRQTVAEMQDLAASSSCHWKGDASQSYYSKLFQNIESMSDVCSNYQKIAETIRTTAQRLYNMEMDAIEIARQRSYSGGGGGHSFGGLHTGSSGTSHGGGGGFR